MMSQGAAVIWIVKSNWESSPHPLNQRALLLLWMHEGFKYDKLINDGGCVH